MTTHTWWIAEDGFPWRQDDLTASLKEPLILSDELHQILEKWYTLPFDQDFPHNDRRLLDRFKYRKAWLVANNPSAETVNRFLKYLRYLCIKGGYANTESFYVPSRIREVNSLNAD